MRLFKCIFLTCFLPALLHSTLLCTITNKSKAKKYFIFSEFNLSITKERMIQALAPSKKYKWILWIFNKEVYSMVNAFMYIFAYFPPPNSSKILQNPSKMLQNRLYFSHSAFFELNTWQYPLFPVEVNVESHSRKSSILYQSITRDLTLIRESWKNQNARPWPSALSGKSGAKHYIICICFCAESALGDDLKNSPIRVKPSGLRLNR